MTKADSGPTATRPSGTVTFLFSDIEGSTLRWERTHDAMAVALRRHDAILRAALEASGGYIFKTVGDAFCAAFETVSGAVAAALDAQRALLAEDFAAVGGVRARMALHTGAAEERDGDYFGPSVNRVARLLAIGYGGQVLASGTAGDVLQDEMQAQVSLRDLGAHRLKDLSRAEHVYQLCAPGLPETFPALRSIDGLPNNLPQQLTSFVGRESDVAEIKTLLETHRLVSLIGAGGSGKTRCAVQVAAELLDGSGDGVWLAELAPVSDASLVATVIAQALSVQESAKRPPLETLLEYLKRKRLLLVLDNCEHVIAEARTVAAAILRNCPEVRILGTSREALNIAGEHVYRMPSLTVPPAIQTLSAQEVLASGAALLFADRAIASDARFSLTDENAPFVAEICRQLDGIPLAIELAAARVKVLSPQQLLQKLDERFRLLTGGDRSALPRQQTMRALIDWSYDLLSEEERSLFRKLAIFAGSFGLEAAAAVCGDETSDEIVVFDRISSLVDKSLVQADPAASGTRYRLLESTRQYACEKLVECGEHASAVRAHAAAYAVLAERLEDSWDALTFREWFVHVEPEIENWRAALAWSLAPGGEMLLGQRMAGALSRAWQRIGMAEGKRAVALALEGVDDTTPSPVTAKLYLVNAKLDATLSQPKASLTSAERALAAYRLLDDLRGIVESLVRAGGALVFMGQISEGETLLAEALTGARALQNRRLTGLVLETLGHASRAANDAKGARARYTEALALYRATGSDRLTSQVATNLAEAEFSAGNAQAALDLSLEALAAAQTLNEERDGVDLSNMAAYLIALGRFDEARLRAREALSLTREQRYAVFFAFTLQHLAAIAALRQTPDDHARAARLLGYADASLSAIDVTREYTEAQEYDRAIAELRAALGEADLTKLMAEGRIFTEDQAAEEGMLV